MLHTEKRELRVALDRAKAPVACELIGNERARRSAFRLANISRSGMFIEAKSEVDIQQGSSINFALRMDEREDEVTGVATVRWVRPRDLGPYMPSGLGVQVVEFHDNAERRYLEFLEDCLIGLRLTDLMTTGYGTLPPEAPVSEAVRLLTEKKSGCVVVTNAGGTPLGIFTKTDLARICTSPTFLAEAVGRHMTPGPFTLTTEQTTEDAYMLMLNGAPRHIPVVEDGLTVGLLSARDLVRYWTESMDLQAKRLSRNYDRAINVIAHDLRTPIGLIQTTNLMLTTGEISSDEYLASGFPEILEHSCEMMMHLIDDILDLQGLKVGAVRLDLQTIDLEELTQGVVRAFMMSASSKKISLRLVVPQPIPRIKADPLRLEQVLNNLVSNALKFSPEGSQVVIGIRPQHSRIALWVADNGPGIAPEELHRLFKEYGGVSNRPTKGEKSTGLGLAIAKRLAEAHGGTIEVESKPGLGTTFTVCLPIGDIQ